MAKKVVQKVQWVPDILELTDYQISQLQFDTQAEAQKFEDFFNILQQKDLLKIGDNGKVSCDVKELFDAIQLL